MNNIIDKKDNKIINEIAHGKFIAAQGEKIWNWSSPAGRIRWERRVKLFNQHIGNDNKDILEVGCGTGLFTAEIAKTKNHITAIDISDDLINLAKKKIISPNVNFKIENAYHTNFTECTFDYILGSSVLHHLEVEKALKEFYRILKSGGKIIFTEPNMLNPQIFLQKNIPWLKRKLGDSPDETAFIRNMLSKEIKIAGFKEVEIIPFDFLHPLIPQSFLPFILPITTMLEKIPVVREFSGSLIIIAQK